MLTTEKSSIVDETVPEQHNQEQTLRLSGVETSRRKRLQRRRRRPDGTMLLSLTTTFDLCADLQQAETTRKAVSDQSISCLIESHGFPRHAVASASLPQ